MKKVHNDLEILRSKIDKIDEKILSLLSMRVKTVLLIGKYKQRNKLKTAQPERENQALKHRIMYGNKLKIPTNLIKSVFSQIFKEFRLLQLKKGKLTQKAK